MMHFIEWLASTSWSIALRESLYLYPWIESAHVLFIAIFFGTLLFVDLRLSGYAFKKLSISEMNRKVLPLSIIGFILMTFTGFLLFYAIPIRNYQNLFFRIKMFLMMSPQQQFLLFQQFQEFQLLMSQNQPMFFMMPLQQQIEQFLLFQQYQEFEQQRYQFQQNPYQ